MEAPIQPEVTIPLPLQSAGGVAGLDRLVDPEPLFRTGRNWTRWAGPAVALLILGAVAYQLRFLNVRQLAAMLPLGMLFWVAFVFCYLSSPIAEWIMFRRLWGLPIQG